MDTKQVTGLQVITAAGARVGAVEQVFFDPTTKRVAAFALQADPEHLDAVPPVVAVAAVHALGADALTLVEDPAARGALTGADLAALVSADDLAKRQVMTAGGVRLGAVAGVAFDPETLELAEIEVSPGFFRGRKAVAAAQVTSLGPAAVMVADAAALEAESA